MMMIIIFLLLFNNNKNDYTIFININIINNDSDTNINNR